MTSPRHGGTAETAVKATRNLRVTSYACAASTNGSENVPGRPSLLLHHRWFGVGGPRVAAVVTASVIVRRRRRPLGAAGFGRIRQGAEGCGDGGHLAVAGGVGLDEGSAVGHGYLDDADLLHVSALDQPAAVRGAQVERPVTFSANGAETPLAVVIEDDDWRHVPATAVRHEVTPAAHRDASERS